MDEVPSQSWFLRKHADGSVSGPISLGGLETKVQRAVIPKRTASLDRPAFAKVPAWQASARQAIRSALLRVLPRQLRAAIPTSSARTTARTFRRARSSHHACRAQ